MAPSGANPLSSYPLGLANPRSSQGVPTALFCKWLMR